MPIIKSSDSGDHITVMVFNKREIEAFVTLLKNANLEYTPENNRAAEILEDMFFAFDVPSPIQE
jgi:hypothetical protein